MPLTLTRPDLFPDDTACLPTPGSAEQAALLADEIEIGTEAFIERLEQMSSLPRVVYEQLVAATRHTVAQALPQRSLSLLDLGSGAGFSALSLLEDGLPISRLTLLDLSPELLQRARSVLARRLGELLPPVEAVELDLLAEDLPTAPGEGFELVVSSNVFHHFPAARQAELVAQVQHRLVPSGVFVLASHFKLVRPQWKHALVDGYLEQMRRSGADEPALAQVEHHMNRFHTYVNLREAYEWLEAAGFGFYECVFRQDEVAVLVAVK